MNEEELKRAMKELIFLPKEKLIKALLDSHYEKKQLIEYLEKQIKEEQYKMNNVRKGFHNYVIARTQRDSCKDILMKVKSGKYDD